MATATPPAPKSLHFFTSRLNSGAPEQALQLAFHRGIALLHLGPAFLDGLLGVRLGAAGGAADAVAPGAAAHQDDGVAGNRLLAAHLGLGHRPHHRADLHALGPVAGIVVLHHLAGAQADLVAVGSEAVRRLLGDPALRKLAGQGPLQRLARIARAGDAHGLVDVGAPAQGIADGAAQAGGGAAERLDLGGVVVRLVLEHQQPRLAPAGGGGVVDVHLDRAGVDLAGHLLVVQLAGLAQGPGRKQGDVHQALGALFRAFEHLGAQFPVVAVGALDGAGVGARLHLDRGDLGEEGGVPAVIRPVGVQQAQLGLGRVAPLLVAEVRLGVLQVGQGHGQAHARVQLAQPLRPGLGESVQDLHGVRVRQHRSEGGRLGQRSHPAVHRIHQPGADALPFGRAQGAPEHVDARPRHQRPGPMGEQLQALGGAVGALVVLARQVFHRQHRLAGSQGQFLVVDLVHRRLREHLPARRLELHRGQPLHVVAHRQAHPLEGGQAQLLAQVPVQGPRLHGEFGEFLHKEAADGGHRDSLETKTAASARPHDLQRIYQDSACRSGISRQNGRATVFDSRPRTHPWN
jgi:hypothetical protein